MACPHAYHAEVAIDALRHGKHVLVEKPLALTLREADAIIAAGRAAGRVVQVGYMRRHAQAFAELPPAGRRDAGRSAWRTSTTCSD